MITMEELQETLDNDEISDAILRDREDLLTGKNEVKMIRVMIMKNGEEFTEFEHWSPDIITKMFNNAMVEMYRADEDYDTKKLLNNLTNALDGAMEGDHL